MTGVVQGSDAGLKSVSRRSLASPPTSKAFNFTRKPPSELERPGQIRPARRLSLWADLIDPAFYPQSNFRLDPRLKGLFPPGPVDGYWSDVGQSQFIVVLRVVRKVVQRLLVGIDRAPRLTQHILTMFCQIPFGVSVSGLYCYPRKCCSFGAPQGRLHWVLPTLAPGKTHSLCRLHRTRLRV